MKATPIKRSHSNSRQPLLWVALAFACGIAAGVYIWRPPMWWLVAAICFAAFALYLVRRRTWAASALGLGALFVAGALTIQARASPDSNGTGLLQFTDGREVLVTAHVTAEGDLLPQGGDESRQTLDVETEQISVGNETHDVRAGLRVGVYLKENEQEQDASSALFHLYQYGERIRFPAKLNAPRNFRNPGAFDYRGYLREKGIIALASTKADQVERLSGFSGSRAGWWRAQIHRSIVNKIRALWPGEQAALVDAILLGDESFIGRPLRVDFQRSGTYHVLVVSGLKVGILAVMTFWLLRRLRVSTVFAGLITVALTIGYALLTEVGAPVWRATLMLALYLGASFFYRRRSALNTIGAAAIALLLVNPADLLGASFQLSFLCILIIAGIGLPLLDRSTQPIARALRHLDSVTYDPSLMPGMGQMRLDLRMVAGRLARFFGKRIALMVLACGARLLVASCEFFLVSLILQVGLALPMAYYFHRVTIVALPANIFAVPLTQLIMIGATVSVALSYVSLTLARIPALAAGVALKTTSGAVSWLGGLRIADARVATPDLAIILAGSAALAVAIVLSRRRLRFAACGLAALTATAAWICTVPPHPRIRAGAMEVTAIDVGQGDSILLVSPQGRTLLVDAGGLPRWMHSELDIGEDVISPYLWARGFSRLDAVAVTHAHADHFGGMGAILANFHPQELWLGANSPPPELRGLLQEAKDLGVPTISRKAGDSFALGGSTVRILAPTADPRGRFGRPNDESIVMKISFGATSALLEGDAERTTERQVAEESPQADLLKVAHHGSATSTIPELLAAVHPQFAVISVGARNVYGHPRREVLSRLGEARVATYRTDLDGAVTFYLDGKRVSAADLR